MRSLSPLELIEAWDAPTAPAAHFRIEALLQAALDGRDISGDTLGRRNQRLLDLRRALGVGRELEAVARCGCGVENELTVPVAAIAGAPTPAPGDRAVVDLDGRRLVARLPTMADLAAVAPIGDPRAAADALLIRCLDPANDHPPLDTAAALRALGPRLEALDPAADIKLAVACVGCGAALTVSVDLALFIGREIGRLVATLLGEVDCLARAYGWTETEILALPASRRCRYVALVRGDSLGDAA